MAEYRMRQFLRLPSFIGVPAAKIVVTSGMLYADLARGPKALAPSPRNIKVLVTLALAIPNGVTGRSDSSQLLD